MPRLRSSAPPPLRPSASQLPRPSAPPPISAAAAGWRLEHSYATLPSLFHASISPTPVADPQLVILNRPLATALGLSADALAGEDGAAIFAGNYLPPGAAPLAQAYAGHQYGHFTTLGDGRAILLGEQLTPANERFDIQIKGSGPTPFSRRGDGRAVLGPMLREYIISEAMHAFGIPTTRSLAVVTTGEEVWRERPLRGAVLTRVAASHLRVGTFQWAAARGDTPALSALVDYTLRRHYPERLDASNRALALLEAVIARQAALIAAWMRVGFVHGVMNTDNMALSGETIDYGPCAFMDAYDPGTVFSSIDRHGRYAYGQQPAIAQWNLTRLAETLLPLLHPEESRAIAIATDAINSFAAQYQEHWLAGMRRKLGLFTAEPEDATLIETLLDWMHTTNADFTNTFANLTRRVECQRTLGGVTGNTPSTLNPQLSTIPPPTDATFRQWHQLWLQRLALQPQSAAESDALRAAHNPAVIPRNHLVESALAAAEQDDLSVLHRLLAALAQPYAHGIHAAEYQQAAPATATRYCTYCGT